LRNELLEEGVLLKGGALLEEGVVLMDVVAVGVATVDDVRLVAALGGVEVDPALLAVD